MHILPNRVARNTRALLLAQNQFFGFFVKSFALPAAAEAASVRVIENAKEITFVRFLPDVQNAVVERQQIEHSLQVGVNFFLPTAVSHSFCLACRDDDDPKNVRVMDVGFNQECRFRRTCVTVSPSKPRDTRTVLPKFRTH
jgi:hypothetical protein